MGIGSSLKSLIEERGTNVRRVSLETGVKASTLYSIIHRDSTKVDLDDLQKLADHLGVSISYFAAAVPPNDGSSTRAHSTAPDPTWSTPLVNAYAAAPRPKQDAVCVVLDIPRVVPGIIDTAAEEDEEDPEPFRVSVQATAAGTGIYLGPEEFITIQVVADCLPQNASFGVPVSGNSMEPKYHDGDILIVSKDKADIGQVGVFTMEGQGYVKVLRNGYLESLNPDYDDIPMTDGTICNGAVIGVLNPDCIVES